MAKCTSLWLIWQEKQDTIPLLKLLVHASLCRSTVVLEHCSAFEHCEAVLKVQIFWEGHKKGPSSNYNLWVLKPGLCKKTTLNFICLINFICKKVWNRTKSTILKFDYIVYQLLRLISYGGLSFFDFQLFCLKKILRQINWVWKKYLLSQTWLFLSHVKYSRN